MTALLILIVLILVLILCLICACVGFIAGRRILIKTSQKPREPTEEEKNKIEKEMREYKNFLNYNGNSQK